MIPIRLGVFGHQHNLDYYKHTPVIEVVSIDSLNVGSTATLSSTEESRHQGKRRGIYIVK